MLILKKNSSTLDEIRPLNKSLKDLKNNIVNINNKILNLLLTKKNFFLRGMPAKTNTPQCSENLTPNITLSGLKDEKRELIVFI